MKTLLPLASAMGSLTLAAGSANAAVIIPVSANASAEWSATATGAAINLLGPGLTVNATIETSTHDNVNWNAAPHTSWMALRGNHTIDFDLGGSFAIEKAHIWNANGAADYNKWGIKDITLRFSEDAVFGNGDDTTQTIALNPGTGLADYTGDHVALTLVPDVTNIRLEVDSWHPGNNGIVALSEVRFSSADVAAIPEPSTTALLGLGGLALLLRRRK